MRHRRPEQRHHRIADELLDRAPEALELRTKMSMVGGEQRGYVLRVKPLRPCREADQVSEENGDHFPLLAARLERSAGQRGAAEGTERKLPWKVLTATRAGHLPILRSLAEQPPYERIPHEYDRENRAGQ